MYETAPVGHADQPDFWNLALALRTELEPAALLTALHAIEAEHGRVRTFRNAPRTLDIDILLYDDRVIDEPGLKVPHPRMHERAFVMQPLAEIGGTVKHSILRREIADLANAIEPDGIRRLFDGAMLLKRFRLC